MNITASGLARFRACPGSSVLPQVKTNSPEAERGKIIHDFLEKSVHLAKEDALRDIPADLYELCKAIDIKSILSEYQDIQTECAYALNPRTRTARFLGRSLGRNYKIDSDEIAGSEDCVAKLRMFPDKWAIADYKSGNYVGPVKTNSQLLFFSACLNLIYGVDEVIASIVYIGEDGSHEIETTTHTIFDINEYLDSLEQACKDYDKCVEQVKLFGMPTVKPGEWCAYCPSLVACPAKTALAKHMLSDIVSIEEKLAALTPDAAGRAWALKKQIGELYFKVDDGLKDYAKQHEIELENGKVVSTTSYNRQYFSESEALKLLESLGASKSEIAGCYSSKEIVSVRELRRKAKNKQ